MYKEKMTDSVEMARQIRMDVARINCRTRDSHIGGGYSSTDILAVLYAGILDLTRENLEKPDRNVFILSKGHIATTMFVTLAYAGLIPYEDLDKHLMNGENYAGHTRRYTVPGVEMSAGSLGHGSCVGCGMAYAKRLRRLGGNVYVLMGDGECNEGSVWESAMFAAKFRLSNLVMIVDRNHFQAYGSDQAVLDMGDLAEKFKSFGCNAVTIDGHDHDAICRALRTAAADKPSKPTVIIADTIKGRGVSFMENRLEWHFKSPDEAQLQVALKELEK